MKNNFLQEGRIIECWHCHPEKYSAPISNGICECICHDKQENWEKQLRYLPQLYKASEGAIIAIENFIKKLLEEQCIFARDEGYEAGLNLRKEYNDPKLLKEIIKELEGKKRGTKNYTNSHDVIMHHDYDYGFNQALTEAIEVIKKK